jgi:hypothetical protein
LRWTIPSRVASRARKQAVLASLLAVQLGAMSVSSTGLSARQVSGELHIAAPTLHFLTGKSLSRLHDGAAVPFDFQLVVASGSKNNVVARALERFTVSYDVWEEKFSVVRVRDLRKSGMRLSASSAESWCLNNIFVPASGLPAGPLWARLEIRSVESREPVAANSGINLATLIEIFSRPSRPQQEHWSMESAAFELSSLKP